jgi:hypothetical protein
MVGLIKNIDKILIGGIALLIFLIAYYSVPFADDFCKQYNDTVLNTIILLFKSGDGRFLSFTGLFMTLGFKYLTFNQMSILWSLFFLGTIFLITKLNTHSTKSNYFIYLTTLTLVIIGSEAYFNEVVFWATGGSVYSVSTFFAVLYLFLLRKFGYNIYTLSVGLLFITIGPNYTIPMLIIIMIEIIGSTKYNLKQKFAYSSYFVLIFGLGILLIVLAPGTEKRLGTVSTFWMWHPRYILEAVTRVIVTGIKCYPITILLIVFILMIEIGSIIKSNTKGIVKKIVSLIYETRFLIASIVSVLVFVKTPGLLSGRAAFFFYILIVLQVFISALKFKKVNINIPIRAASFVLIILLVSTLIKTRIFNIKYNDDMISNEVKTEYLLENYVYNNINVPFKRTEKLNRDEFNIWAEQCFDRYRLRK